MYSRACTRTTCNTHIPTHTQTHTCKHTHTRACAHCVQIAFAAIRCVTHTLTHTHSHIYTQTYTHDCSHTYTHMYTQTYSLSLFRSFSPSPPLSPSPPPHTLRLRHMQIDTRLLVLKWWITCFVSVLPPHQSSLLIDHMLCHGISTLVSFTMSLLQYFFSSHPVRSNSLSLALALGSHGSKHCPL